MFWLCFFGKEGRGLKAWHAVGVLEQRSGPDPTNASDCFIVVVCLVWVCWL